MVIVVAVMIGSFIMISNKNTVLQIIGWVLSGSAVLGMVIHYFATKNKFPSKTKEYISLVTTSLNARSCIASEFKDVTASNEEKLDSIEITADGVYQNINQLANRNVIRGLYSDRSFLVSDLALYNQSGRNRTTHFVGKYISYQNDLAFEGRYVFIRKNNETPIDEPNALEGLAVLFEEEGFLIYGPEKGDYKSIFSKKLIDSLKEIKLDEVLLNVAVVFWGGHSAAYLSYSDVIIALPFDKPFDKEAFEKYVVTQNQILEIFKLILNK